MSAIWIMKFLVLCIAGVAILIVFLQIVDSLMLRIWLHTDEKNQIEMRARDFLEHPPAIYMGMCIVYSPKYHKHYIIKGTYPCKQVERSLKGYNNPYIWKAFTTDRLLRITCIPMMGYNDSQIEKITKMVKWRYKIDIFGLFYW